MITAVPPTIIAFPPVVTPITGTIATPTTAAVATTPSTVSTLAELSTSEKKDVMSRARTNICSFIVAEEAVPAESTRNEMVARAIRMALELVVGFVQVAKPASATKDVIGMMANTQRAYKQYVLCHMNSEFSLRLEPGIEGSEIEHHAERVGFLLENMNYLRDPRNPNHEFFSSSFFQNFMIDMLFLTPMNLWQFVRDNTLDTVFGLAGAAIAATLKDFRQGYHSEFDSSAIRWRDDYLEAIQLISHMRDDPARKDWLDSLQQLIMARGRAGLPPTDNTFI